MGQTMMDADTPLEQVCAIATEHLEAALVIYEAAPSGTWDADIVVPLIRRELGTRRIIQIAIDATLARIENSNSNLARGEYECG
jgi:hypothetical protein